MSLGRRPWTLGHALIAAAVLCFVLVAFGVDVSGVDLLAVGLALGFAGLLTR
jgi:uncharacterized membrane protein YbhN (UPF0104 family)